MVHPTCTVPECEKPARSASADLCPMHYHRKYRHGSVTKVARGGAPSASNGRRYRTRHVGADHPLASKHGVAYVHRVVVFETYGAGPLKCHYCSKGLYWDRPKGSPEAVQVDHLNDMGDDNRPENLVPCCARCNVAKAGARRHAALTKAGWWSSNDTIAQLRAGGRVDMAV